MPVTVVTSVLTNELPRCLSDSLATLQTRLGWLVIPVMVPKRTVNSTVLLVMVLTIVCQES